MKIQTYLALSILFFLFGCDKELNLTFTGKVTMETNGSPAANTTLELWETKDINGTINPTLLKTGTVQTDNNGNYSVSTNPGGATEYFLRVADANYFMEEQRFIPDNLSHKDPNTVDFTVKPAGSIFISADVQTPGTRILISKRNGTIGEIGSCLNGDLIDSQSGENSTICTNDAGQYFKYEYQITTSMEFIRKTDSLLVRQGDSSLNQIIISY